MVLQATMRAPVNHMQEEQMISVRMEVGSNGGAAQVILDTFVAELVIEEWGRSPIVRIRAKGLVIDMPRELALQLATAVTRFEEESQEESKLEQARLEADPASDAYTGLPPITD